MVDDSGSCPRHSIRIVAALVSCYCLVIVAAVIVLGLGTFFLLLVELFPYRVSSHSCGTLREPILSVNFFFNYCFALISVLVELLRRQHNLKSEIVLGYSPVLAGEYSVT